MIGFILTEYDLIIMVVNSDCAVIVAVSSFALNISPFHLISFKSENYRRNRQIFDFFRWI
jgi:hypothetical protein